MQKSDEARDFGDPASPLTIILGTILVAIVQAIFDEVEHLLERARLPSVGSLRPTSCPLCGQLAQIAGEPLGIVGHGTYRRQVLGLSEVAAEATTLVRRYLCRGCAHTMSVLSDYLHPRRWYAAVVILEALRRHLVDGKTEAEVRCQFGVQDPEGSWRRRWRRGLLVALWFWLGKRLGVTTPAATRSEGRRRVVALLTEAALGTGRAPPPSAACALGNSTVHFQGVSWPLDHDPPEEVRQKFRCK